MDSNKITICTIISKNYLAFARTLTDSFLKFHPNGKVFVLLVDELHNLFDPKKEKFTLVNINELGIESLENFCFKYTVLEQNTGAKAHFLKYLFEKYQLKKLAYFDPDILFTNSLENLWKVLDKKSIVLTPHLTAPIHDDKKPTEDDIMRSGVYNLGFIALANTKITQDFLKWWMPHLMEAGYSDVKNGMFTDQKWIDSVPSQFDDVYIIRHSGYNVAYWNLMQRQVEIFDGKINVNGKPLYFFHFSGFSPENLENVSKHQNRFTLEDLEETRPIFELYRDLLVENGYFDSNKWKCKFDYFNNGIKIPSISRRLYADSIKKGKSFGNPFDTTGSNTFIEFLNQSVDKKQPVITNLWYKIYQLREDLQENFPDPLNKDREVFLKWIRESVDREYKFDEIFLPSTILKNINQYIDSQQTDSKLVFEESKKTNQISEISKLNKRGINIAGYFKGQFGVAESARSFVWAIKNAGIPYVLNNVNSVAQKNNDDTFTKFEKNNPYPINLIVVNADQIDFLYQSVGANYFKDKYNIAIWAWELSNFPTKWVDVQKYFDEIWVLSNFVAKSISKKLSIPVLPMKCPIEIDESMLIKNRNKFGIEENVHVFLFIFDFLSVFERKNPLAIVEAFKKAFSNNENALLVLKCINSSKFPTEFSKLKNVCKEENIKILDQNFEKNDMLSLIASCDCYISLHRSEGLGLTLAEAMFAEKPVIATGYGGNTDFMNINNSFLVKYKLVEIEKDYGPYKKGNYWAEPDVEDAASLMKFIFENQNDTKKIAKAGSIFIKQNMSVKLAGEEILKRIKKLENQN